MYYLYMKVNYTVVGKHIKEIRLARGITQAELAERVERSTTFIAHIENGTKRPGLETLINIASALGSTVDEILLGNQPVDKMTYQREIREVLEGCSVKQRDFILYVIRGLREGLRVHDIK